ncbi:MAG: hypothetical protein D6683_04090 [Actinomyces sp.]|nr:MAG: hypothetical protein D6683_04090 [Actinomyces sp.]
MSNTVGEAKLIIVPEFDRKRTKELGTVIKDEFSDAWRNSGIRRQGRRLIGEMRDGIIDESSKILAGGVLSSVGLSFVEELGAPLEQIETKVATVFGDTRDEIEAWAANNAHSFGLTRRELLKVSADFADLIVPMGATREQAESMTEQVVGLAGALSEWTGGERSAAEVAHILSSAMLGEREALKGLGISIREAEVQQRALAIAQADGRDQVTQLDRALATQQLIFAKSKDAQRAFAEGSDTLARRQAEARAKLAETREELTEALVPAVSVMADQLSKFAGGVNTATQFLTHHVETLMVLGATVGGGFLTAKLGLAAASMSRFVVEMKQAIEAAGGLRSAISQMSKFNFAAAGVGAALGVATFAVIKWRKAQQQARERVERLTESLRTQAGTISVLADGWEDYIAQQSEFAKNNQIDDLRRLNMTFGDLQDVVTGGTDGLRRFIKAAVDAGEISLKSGVTVDQLAENFDNLEITADGVRDGWVRLADGNTDLLDSLEQTIEATAEATRKDLERIAVMDGIPGVIRQQVDELLAAKMSTVDFVAAWEQLRPTVEKYTSAADDATGSTGDMADTMGDAADETASLSDEVDQLRDALDDLFGAQQDVDEATLDLLDKFDKLTEAAAEAEGQTSIYTESGRRLTERARDAASAMRDLTLAELANGESLDMVREKQDRRIDRLRRELEQAGFTRSEIEDLIDTYALVPDEVATDIIANHEDADTAVSEFRRRLDELDGRTVAVSIAMQPGHGHPSGVATDIAPSSTVVLPPPPDTLRRRARGGLVRGGHPAIVGEVPGQDELVLPIARPADLMALVKAFGGDDRPRIQVGDINVTVTGGDVDPWQVAREVRDTIVRLEAAHR